MLICPGWESGGGCAWLPWASAGEVDQGTAESRTPSVRGESREKNGIHPQNSHYGGTPLIIQTLMEFGGGAVFHNILGEGGLTTHGPCSHRRLPVASLTGILAGSSLFYTYASLNILL